jgi:hypothetical protein
MPGFQKRAVFPARPHTGKKISAKKYIHKLDIFKNNIFLHADCTTDYQACSICFGDIKDKQAF